MHAADTTTTTTTTTNTTTTAASMPTSPTSSSSANHHTSTITSPTRPTQSTRIERPTTTRQNRPTRVHIGTEDRDTERLLQHYNREREVVDDIPELRELREIGDDWLTMSSHRQQPQKPYAYDEISTKREENHGKHRSCDRLFWELYWRPVSSVDPPYPHFQPDPDLFFITEE